MRPAFHFTLLHYVLLGVKNSSAFVRVATRFPFKCSLSYTEDNHSIDSQIEEEEEDEEGFLFGNSKKTTNKQNWKRNHGTTDELLEAVNVYKGGNGSLTSKSSSGISAFASPTTRKDGQIFLNSQLKRNLVQETVRAYKDDLFRELSTGVSSASNYSKFDDSVCDKLTSLIQVNPVSTTTDSNLLEGKWEFAYMAPNASKVVNGKPSRLEVRKEKGENSENIQVGCRSRWTSALSGFLSTSSRIIVLENLIESEDPYLVDVVRIVGGLFKVQSRSIVDGLTRTSLKLSSDGSKQFGVGPFVFSSKQKHQNNHKSLTFENLYLDSDLCISMTELGEHGPLYVYTKSEIWNNSTSRSRRRFQSFLAILWLIESPLHLRQRARKIFSLFSFIRTKQGESVEDKIVVDKITGSSKLKVLKIGEAAPGSITEDKSWEGFEDPFVYLDAESRQETMKKMSIRDIKKASETLKRNGKRRTARRRKKLKPPNT